MKLPRVLFALRVLFFFLAVGTNLTFGIFINRENVVHSNICWWLFSLETFALMYYAFVEFVLNRLAFARLSVLGITASAIATQGVLSNSLDPTVSRILTLLVGVNLGFIFSVGTRLKILKVDEEPVASLTKAQLKLHNGESSRHGEITPAEDVEDAKDPEVIIKDFKWKDVFSESSENNTESIATETDDSCLSSETLSLSLGVIGLVLGITGWVLNLSIWIHECFDKNTCQELGPQWWTLVQTSLLFVIYIISVGMNRSFEILATYSILWAIPVSIFLRVANTARSDIFYLENQEDTYQTWDSDGTIVGSSLIAISGALLLISLGITHYSWKAPAPEHTRSFRAVVSLIGLLGLIIFGIGLHNAQKEVCKNNDQHCEWYDGLWVDLSFEVLIVLFGTHSVFSQPGESIRAILVALTVLPSYAYTINITRFLEHWYLEDMYGNVSNYRWAIRFSGSGLIMLFCVNYAWMFAWGWGKSESLESKLGKGYRSSLSASLLKSARAKINKQNEDIMRSTTQGVELGVINEFDNEKNAL